MTVAMLMDGALPFWDRIFVTMPLAEQVEHTPVLIFGVLEFCLGIAYVALWRAATDHPVFRTLGFFYLLVGFEQFWQYFGGDASVWCLRCVAVAVLVEAAAEAMDVENHRWTWLFWPLYGFVMIAGWFPGMAFVHEWPVIASEVTLAILIVQGFRHGNRRDRMVASAFAVHFVVRASLIPSLQKITGIRNLFVVNGWQWQYTTITLTLLGIATLVIFVGALIRDREDKRRMATELESARAIQQLLIPDQIPYIAGFEIQSAYRPFGEVGGDFFQIIPLPSGGALIAIGDVSGKGLPAAMQVSLVVGNLRALTDYTQSPGEILRGINRHMIGRSNGGFTTCLLIRVDHAGGLTLANAGHIAPYVDGVELDCENGFPLGLVPDAEYPECVRRLSSRQQLTVMTDGVVEASNKDGELFGFARTQFMSRQTAEKIAETAQSFGQDDDITVLTVTRSARTGDVTRPQEL
jgi:hypothetical protein